MVDLGWVKVKMEVVDLRSVGSLEEMRHLLDAQLRGVCAHELAAPRAACVDEAFARVRGLVEGLCGSDLGRGHAARLEAVSDVRGHLGRLEALAADARSVLECGVRHGVASWALAHGLARSWRRKGRRRLVRNDVAADVGAEPRFLAAVAAAGVRVEEHWSVSDLHLDVGAVDVVFIDTLHTYGQLRRELEKFGATTRSYIAIHDTEVDGQRGEALEGLEEHLSIERWEALDADTASFDTADLLKFAPLDLEHGVRVEIQQILGEVQVAEAAGEVERPQPPLSAARSRVRVRAAPEARATARSPAPTAKWSAV
ncbi:hypothetical protein JL720_4418 [Aureococcus anophagefferens]|nr:hypothetical protein JL720_4418 [Aureococcus anophagefferens]